MDRKAHDGVHDRPVRNIDRNLRRKQGQCIAQAVQPAFRQQKRFDPEPGLLQQDPEDHLAFRDEAMLAPDEIALADGAVSFDPRIVGI